MTEAKDKVERRIRKEMGNEIFAQANLPLDLEGGRPVYNGEVTLAEYRNIFHAGDGRDTFYLTAKSFYPLWAKAIAVIMEYERRVDEAKGALVREQDFQGAQQMRDEHIESTKRICSELVKKLTEATQESPSTNP